LDANLSEALDSEICRYAEVEGRIIISKDEDFFYLAKQREAKIRVIWVRMGNCRTSALLAAFQRSWTRIESCLEAGDLVIEVR
jgi:predicted nuclease of predicted toxin-antitoxin system